ncbi:hypothetical protein BJX63DRAFT_434474 [Aspergillus granulosus]|uniref:Nucleoside phosphorylase domain-containing protein n=1 Tax=Aspergillus granulosus TaxID=176169 RepID=A0ABR4H469_9EURO
MTSPHPTRLGSKRHQDPELQEKTPIDPQKMREPDHKEISEPKRVESPPKVELRKKVAARKKLNHRIYTCPFRHYGCTNNFPTKNEWKRHVAIQHLQLGFYRCDVGRCGLVERPEPLSEPRRVQYSDFNRKDLFIQHQRRIHAPWLSEPKEKRSVTEEERAAYEASLEDVWKRCWIQTRLPPQTSRCGFCGREFRGEGGWSERMEHVSRHIEKGDPGPEEEDPFLREWALEQGFVRWVDGAWKLTSLPRTGAPGAPPDQAGAGEIESPEAGRYRQTIPRPEMPETKLDTPRSLRSAVVAAEHVSPQQQLMNELEIHSRNHPHPRDYRHLQQPLDGIDRLRTDGTKTARRESGPVSWSPNTRKGVPADSGYGTQIIQPKPALAPKPNHGGWMPVNPYPVVTVYSGMPVMSSTNDGFISAFADALLKSIFTNQRDWAVKAKALDRITELLQAFADKLGYDTTSQPLIDVRYYIHKHRNDIAECIWERYPEDLISRNSRAIDAEKMSLQEKARPWLRNREIQTKSQDTTHHDGESVDRPEDSELQESSSEEEDDKSASNRLQSYLASVLDTPAYQWLVDTLQKSMSLSFLERQSLSDIAAAVIRSFAPFPQVSRKAGTGAVKASFVIEWSPIAFFKGQRYEDRADVIFDKVLTLTGSLDDAQALTCGEYMRQTWPTTGMQIMAVIKKALSGSQGESYECVLPGGTTINLRIKIFTVIVKAIGTRTSVAEVAEQFAWLGATLRASSNDHGVALCRPYIKSSHGSRSSSADEGPKVISSLQFHISFEVKEPDTAEKPKNGRCWHNIFRNPVVAEGFPIRTRHMPNIGMEASLGVLGALVPSRRLTVFGNKLYIKGFSTVLVPTKVVGDKIIWHMVFDKNGGYVSYVDPEIDTLPGLYPANISECSLDSFRHVLGWCSEAELLTGTPEANYSIDWSNFRIAGRDCGLFDVRIHPGNFISDTSVVALGERDKAIHTREDYSEQILWISKQFVVLYDAESKRSWLVDGASALLHLVRASLKEDESYQVDDDLIYNPQNLQKLPSTIIGREAARKTLTSAANARVKIYASSGQTFRDRVERVFHIMEQCFAHQDKVSRERSAIAGFSGTGRECLEGFDFMDVAMNNPKVHARAHADQGYRPSWLALTSKIGAIILFGRNFKELIIPKGGNKICAAWSEVPADADYLTVCASDLKDIMEKQGNPNTSPLKLAEDVYWQPSDSIYGPCTCDKTKQETCNHAQTLLYLSDNSTVDTKPRSLRELPGEGAIIFKAQWGGDKPKVDAIPAPNGKHPASPNIKGGPAFNDGAARVKAASESPGVVPRQNGIQQKRPAPVQEQEQFDKRPRHAAPFRSFRPLVPSPPKYVTPPLANHSYAYGIRSVPGPQVRLPEQRQPIVRATPHTQPYEALAVVLREEDYTVGWICALPVELSAARRMLDKVHNMGYGPGTDDNLYILGQIRDMNVVIAFLPMGQAGASMTAVVATRMMQKFPKIEIGLMVGIGGGLPSPKQDIRLGDIVVSKPHLQHGGVAQYDLRRATRTGFTETGCTKAPPEKLLLALSMMASRDNVLNSRLTVDYPGPDSDRLYDSSYPHSPDHASCEACDIERLVPWRSPRPDTRPRIFYGTIASGVSVINEPQTRETLIQKHHVMCCEMEAAGLMNTGFPCIVIRGIADYADSHKSDTWQDYAAEAAAQYARDFLCSIPGRLSFLK